MTTDDPMELESRFTFGKNWQGFIETVTEENVAAAKRGLTRLFPRDEIKDHSFLDIGCGSGLSMLAAARLGARSVYGIDVDPASIQATRALLSRFLPNGRCGVRVASVFDLSIDKDGAFDIVYSWGVLHHTGDLWKAARTAAALVAPGGYFAVALYRKTPLCRFWRREKQFYSQANKLNQKVVRLVYQGVYCAGLLATGRSPIRYVRDYKSARGMNWYHDVHDWLGGYPYVSVEPEEALGVLEELGLAPTRVFEKPAAVKGLLGSHCDEFVAFRLP